MMETMQTGQIMFSVAQGCCETCSSWLSKQETEEEERWRKLVRQGCQCCFALLSLFWRYLLDYGPQSRRHPIFSRGGRWWRRTECRPHHGAGCPAVGWVLMAAYCCMWGVVSAEGLLCLPVQAGLFGSASLAAALLKGSTLIRELKGKKVHNQWCNLIGWASLVS